MGEPLIEHIKERQQHRARLTPGQFGRSVEEGFALPLMPPLECLDNQLVFGLEVVVKGRLGDAHLGEDLVQAHRVEAVHVEPIDRDLEELVAGRGRLGLVTKQLGSALTGVVEQDGLTHGESPCGAVVLGVRLDLESTLT